MSGSIGSGLYSGLPAANRPFSNRRPKLLCRCQNDIEIRARHISAEADKTLSLKAGMDLTAAGDRDCILEADRDLNAKSTRDLRLQGRKITEVETG